MKVAVVLGTRPEIIKMSPIIRECERLNLEYFILHTGQHYSYNMDKAFFEHLELPNTRYNLEIGPGSHGEQTGKAIAGIEKVLKTERPDVVLVEGDTNSTFAGAFAATKLGIKVGHVEAGLRSYDRTMPEEVNRVLIDHCSDYLFAPTEKAKTILSGEGITKEKIFVTGNTIVDAVYQNLEIANRTRKTTEDLCLQPQKYFIATVHRQENVDNKKRFSSILKGLEKAGTKFDAQIVFPIHPRSRKRIKEYHLRPSGIQLVDPVDFLSFLQLEKNAKLVFTDSGGVQEETCILKVPCITLRDNTERPETIEVGSNILAGTDPRMILKYTKRMLRRKNNWANPFGDGNAGKRIIEILKDQLGSTAPSLRGIGKSEDQS